MHTSDTLAAGTAAGRIHIRQETNSNDIYIYAISSIYIYLGSTIYTGYSMYIYIYIYIVRTASSSFSSSNEIARFRRFTCCGEHRCMQRL